MFVAANFISSLAIVLDYALTFYWWMIIARALLSWVSPDPYNPIVQFLHRATEPVLDPIRRQMGYGMGIDLSPMVVMLVIMFLQKFLVQSMMQWAAGIG